MTKPTDASLARAREIMTQASMATIDSYDDDLLEKLIAAALDAQASSPPVDVSDEEIEAEWDAYRQKTLAESSTVSIRKVWYASSRWMRARMKGEHGK